MMTSSLTRAVSPAPYCHALETFYFHFHSIYSYHIPVQTLCGGRCTRLAEDFAETFCFAVNEITTPKRAEKRKLINIHFLDVTYSLPSPNTLSRFEVLPCIPQIPDRHHYCKTALPLRRTRYRGITLLIITTLSAT